MDGKTKAGLAVAGLLGIAAIAAHENTEPLPSKAEYSLCRLDDHHKVQPAGKFEMHTHSDANGPSVDFISSLPMKVGIDAKLKDGNHISTFKDLVQQGDQYRGSWPNHETWDVRNITKIDVQSEQDGTGACSLPLDKEGKVQEGTEVRGNFSIPE